jgi:hypothetical protein
LKRIGSIKLFQRQSQQLEKIRAAAEKTGHVAPQIRLKKTPRKQCDPGVKPGIKASDRK